MRPAILIATFLLAAARAEEAPPEPNLPATVFELAAPPVPPNKWQEYDLHEVTAESLRASARQLAYEQSRPAEAAQLQYFAVQDRPGRGLYQLGCYHALAGEMDAALYWLQRAAREEGGVEPGELEADADLATLREDPRWAPLVEYVEGCYRAWVTSARLETTLLLPAGHDGKEPLRVVVMLHAYGSAPAEIAGETEQALADRLGVAILAPSASIPIGPAKYRWTEQLELDSERVKLALQETAATCPLVPGEAVLVGFSQGAQLAAELLASDPQSYSGAIVVCPGFATPSIDSIEADAALANRVCIIVSGEREKPGNREQARADAEWFQKAGSIVVHHTFAEMGHQWPPGTADHLAVWLQFLFGLRARADGE